MHKRVALTHVGKCSRLINRRAVWGVSFADTNAPAEEKYALLEAELLTRGVKLDPRWVKSKASTFSQLLATEDYVRLKKSAAKRILLLSVALDRLPIPLGRYIEKRFQKAEQYIRRDRYIASYLEEWEWFVFIPSSHPAISGRLSS